MSGPGGARPLTARSAQLYLAGDLIGTFQPAGDASHVVWTHYSFTGSAPSGDGSIFFLGTAGSGCGVIIDSVSITANP